MRHLLSFDHDGHGFAGRYAWGEVAQAASLALKREDLTNPGPARTDPLDGRK